MRISGAEKEILVNSIRQVDREARIWLFGSRVDDTKKGGDIDIAVLSPNIRLSERMLIRRSIVDCLGEQRIDMLVSADGTEPFFRLAIETGVQLDE
jgi:predicted nucleotidyltransferase